MMKLFRGLVNLLLLIITPTFLLTPHTKLIATEHVPFGIALHRALNAENNLLFSYDELMALIDDLESDRSPEDYSIEEIERTEKPSTNQAAWSLETLPKLMCLLKNLFLRESNFGTYR